MRRVKESHSLIFTALVGLALAGLWAPAVSATEPAAAEGAATEEASSTEGWLQDEDGKYYKVGRLEKHGNHFKWMGEGRVRTHYGIVIDVVDEDDESFYYKVYKTEPFPGNPDTGPTEEEIAAAEATYVVNDETVDRLEFKGFDQGLPKQGQWRNGFEIVDFDKDGNLDIVHGPPRKGGVWPVIFRGDGKGTWSSWREIQFPRRYDYGDVAVADYNADGHLDIALAIHLRGVRVLVNDGKGNFSEWTRGTDYAVPGRGGDASGFSSRTIEAVDWNGDGRPDLLALGEGPKFANPTSLEAGATKTGAMNFVSYGPVVYLNQGNGQWVRKDHGPGPNVLFGDSLAVADFNVDGRIDFATSSNMMTRRDLINLGDAENDWASQMIPEVRPNGYVRAVATGDVDKNGRPDLAVAYVNFELAEWRTGVDILLSQQDGTWKRRPITARDGRVAYYSVDLGDFDGDGNLDVVAVDGDGDIVISLGDGTGEFVREESPELAQPVGRCRGYTVRTADIDGDGRDELFGSFADEPSAYFDADRCPQGGGMGGWTPAVKSGATVEAAP